MSKMAIVGATLIDGTGAQPIPNAVIVFEGNTIISVGSGHVDTLPDDVQIIDASGKYVIPGIVNANVHLIDGFAIMLGNGLEYLARFEGRYHEVIEESAQIALRSGMTTVFDTWNAHGPVLYARDRIASGQVPGSRVYAAGNIVGMGGPFSADFSKESRNVMTRTFADRIDTLFEAGVGRRLAALPPEEVRAIIRDYLDSGIDFLKFAISDHIMSEAMNPHLTFSERVQRIIAEETRAAGKPLVSHTTSIESLNNAVELGVDAMMHCTLTAQVVIPDDIIEKMIKKSVWGEIQPVTNEYQRIMEAEGQFMAGYAGGAHRESTIRLIKAGAPILMGTDAGCTDPDNLCDHPHHHLPDRPVTLGNDHFLWHRSMHQLGMKPMDILMASTLNVAKAYHKQDVIGSIEVGKWADILILGGNPLEDIENFQSIDTIIQAGKIIDRDTLPVKKVVTQYPRMEAHQH
ncbi:TPA: amidohydrolase family protein [Pseudomonas aeruginosa]|uniref:amidohydrolase family protein n=1 Tax=Pseudomonas aeruginosa TaxID=287 RepID=UPI000B48BC30|nr:amidohydrolase family protein [Pseudomonas aeruginosa]MBG4351715.1 amidohydrolase family protein [Pseudomonas aeruginosa]MCU9105289.1 amidohydrolase family protein [Pseudomonas aeruginosa]MCU9249765.1 amidohydrolase family protein [Pseudomonas aeruginosa]MCU9304570.1 amidohydrolase family protein [Pseudomonas aeruginosa]MCU9510321.1 amidohydrolase family protein [Pseudomonas aeruginosa]